MHHKEFRRWKSSQLNRLLPDTATWKELRRQIPQTFASLAASQPPVEDFADLLEDLFRGSTVEPQRPDHLEEPPWTLEELTAAIKRLKCKRGADDAGLAAELLKHAPIEILHVDLWRSLMDDFVRFCFRS